MTSYCQYVLENPGDEYNKRYHDTQYGFPLDDDNQLFGRLILEINQAGLSWQSRGLRFHLILRFPVPSLLFL